MLLGGHRETCVCGAAQARYATHLKTCPAYIRVCGYEECDGEPCTREYHDNPDIPMGAAGDYMGILR